MSNMVVQTNVYALNSHRNLKTVGTQQAKASARLASGYRINSAADDAAGLAISEKMRAQIRGLDMAARNAMDGQAMINTAEGGLQEITNMIQRIRELTVQRQNSGTLTSEDQGYIDEEVGQLITEISQMAGRTKYNNKALLSKTATSLTFQVGANSGQTMSASISGFSLKFTKATATLSAVETALKDVNTLRAKLGAYSNRLDYTVRSLEVASENLSDAESRVRNTDMAKEMMNYTKANVLQQAAVSMLAQANQLPQNLLSLLR